MIPPQEAGAERKLELARIKRQAVEKVAEFLEQPPGSKIEIPEEVYPAFWDVLGEVTMDALAKLKKEGLI